jgi:hypothetical protein
VTLWPLLTHVHRTVSPTLMLISFGTNAKPCPTVTSKIWLVPNGTPFGTGCPSWSTILRTPRAPCSFVVRVRCLYPELACDKNTAANIRATQKVPRALELMSLM